MPDPRIYPQIPAGIPQTRVVPRRVIRAEWSQQKIFLGESVELIVGTNMVEDGTAIQLEVAVHEGEVLTTLDGTIQEEAYLHPEFKVELPEPDPARSPYPIVFRVKIESLDLVSDPSEPLAVHVEGFRYSQ